MPSSTRRWPPRGRKPCSFGALNEGPRLDRLLMFEDVYKEFPENLRRQREQLDEEIKLNAELGFTAKTEESDEGKVG